MTSFEGEKRPSGLWPPSGQAPVIGHTRAHAPPLTPPHAVVGGQKSRFQAKNRKVNPERSGGERARDVRRWRR
ncbi:hypothetical protein F383_25786 [Gossypium arboreum]|uniref:Uncharacterized protein n=1 Tax=Gossypium arboreum TaxID=29729 RepID=A0A0B0MJY1_GOSAR|nr:hypothetical protein F383_25786 [Gossypium arboreum]